MSGAPDRYAVPADLEAACGAMVLTIARRHESLRRNLLELDDLIGIGWLGLYRARDTYRPDRGRTFSSWAYLQIKYAIQREAGTFYGMRSSMRAKPIALGDESLDRVVDKSDDQAQIDAREEIARALRGMPRRWISTQKRERTVRIVADFLSGAASISELARQHGVSRQRIDQLVRPYRGAMKNMAMREAG